MDVHCFFSFCCFISCGFPLLFVFKSPERGGSAASGGNFSPKMGPGSARGIISHDN